jgi:hypothetical protein
MGALVIVVNSKLLLVVGFLLVALGNWVTENTKNFGSGA